MSTIQKKHEQANANDAYFDGYIVGKTVEEVHAQEAAAFDRFIMKQSMEMSRPKAERPKKSPK